MNLWRSICVHWSVMACLAGVCAAECKEPTATKKTELVAYIMKKYQVESSSDLVVTGSNKANDACFWKMEYASMAPKQKIVLYLSPDREYLMPALYDVKQDPLMEMKQQDAATLKTLLAGGPSEIGPKSAPVTIIEFSDFQCPFCKKMTDILEKEVLPKEASQVKVVFRNYPLPMHPWAKDAAEMAECAALQKPAAFWQLHDFFFQNQQILNPDNLKDKVMAFIADDKDVDKTAFAACVDRELGMGPVTQDQELGQKMGIQGTPTFYVNGVRFNGVHTGEEMLKIIDQAARGELVSSTPAADRSATPSAAPYVASGARPNANSCSPVGAR